MTIAIAGSVFTGGDGDMFHYNHVYKHNNKKCNVTIKIQGKEMID